MFLVEAIRKANTKYGPKVITRSTIKTGVFVVVKLSDKKKLKHIFENLSLRHIMATDWEVIGG